MESGQSSVVDLFCRKSEHVKPVDCFRRGAPSLIFDGFLNVTLCEEVSTTGLHKGILNYLYVLILLIYTKHKNNKIKSCTHPISSFSLRRFIHWVDNTENVWLINSRVVARKSWMERYFPQSPWMCTTIRPEFSVTLIYFFYLHTTIWQKYMNLFHLIFLLYTTIWPKLRVLIDLFILCANNHLTQIYGSFSFILSFVTTIQPRLRILTDLFLLFAHDHSTKIYDPLSFNLSFVTTIRPKIRVLINLFISFVHDHSTKI